MNILDLFGVPAHGGSLVLLCQWRVDAELAARAGDAPVRLATHLRDEAGDLIRWEGPRSRPFPASEDGALVAVPLFVPARVGRYELEMDVVCEPKEFWASWYSWEPRVLRVERLPNGDLFGEAPQPGRRYQVRWPTGRDGRRFRIPHDHYGMGESERCVEIPWVLSRYRGERRVLDVGYAFAEERYLDPLAALDVPCLVGIDLVAAAKPMLRSVVADTRHPPFRDGSIALVLAISVIEHIGRDNSVYLDSRADRREDDGDFEAVRALGTLLAPTGRLLLTVPFGAAVDYGWFVQYDAARLDSLVAASGLVALEAEFYRYRDGWEGPVDPKTLAGSRSYYGAPAAAGLACLALGRRPAPPGTVGSRRPAHIPASLRRLSAGHVARRGGR